jgi:hypothetical protein
MAVFLAKSELFVKILVTSKELEWMGSIIAGMFFTSFFTTAPAIVTLGALAKADSIFAVAFFGAIGSVIGDMVIFRFFKDKISLHITDFIGHEEISRKVRYMLRSRFFKWLPAFIGGLIIASPLPDELGVAFFSFSKIKPRTFIILSYMFNFIGILLIGIVAKTL